MFSWGKKEEKKNYDDVMLDPAMEALKNKPVSQQPARQ